MSLHDVTYARDGMHWDRQRLTEPESRLAEYLDEARELFAASRRPPDAEAARPATTADFEHLRWFPLPHEA